MSCPLDKQCKFKPRALPREPHDSTVEFFVELFQFALAIGARRQRNRPVGVQMVDVQKREECVQRGIDGGCNPALAERRKWIVGHHLVFVRFAAIQFFEVLEAVKIKKCKS